MERLNLNTFGETKYKKTFCSDIPHCLLASTLDGLELAHELIDAKGSIDMLISRDYYWDFITGKTTWGEIRYDMTAVQAYGYQIWS